MEKIIRVVCLAATLVFSSSSFALTIADLDLNSLSFEVDNLASGSATGTSNGIGYSLEGNYFVPFSNNNSSQPYNDLPNRYDDLHLGAEFTITFDQGIDYLLLGLANDNNTGIGIDFGIAPTELVDVSIVSGTQTAITDINGGLLLYVFSSPITTLTHFNPGFGDGFDVSFFAGNVSTVPVPAAAWLFGSAILGFIGFGRRKNKT